MIRKKLPFVWEVKKADAISLFCGTQHLLSHDYDNSIRKLLEGKKIVLLEQDLEYDEEEMFSDDEKSPPLRDILTPKELGKLDFYRPFFEEFDDTGQGIEDLCPLGFYGLINTKLVNEDFYCIDLRIKEIAEEQGIKVVGLQNQMELKEEAASSESFIPQVKAFLALITISPWSETGYSDFFLRCTVASGSAIYSSGDLFYYEGCYFDHMTEMSERNVVMIKRAEPHIEKGDALLAVGIAHFVNEFGILEGYKRKDYEIRRISL